MLHGCRFRPVFFGVFGSIILLVVSARAETLYHWKGKGGEAVYSNVSPPSGVEEFSVSTGFSSGVGRVRSAEIKERTVSRGSSVVAEAESEPAPVSDQTAQFLQDRILSRETSVRQIEKLLRSDPDDSSLRRQLLKKKQSIREDRIRLGAIAN